MSAFRQVLTGVVLTILAASPRVAQAQDTSTTGTQKAPATAPREHAATAAASTTPAADRIDINSASKDSLMTLKASVTPTPMRSLRAVPIGPSASWSTER